MTITLQAVNELIASLESAGELSIREQKFLKLAKAFKQLAAENVELKQSERELDKTCSEEFGQDWVSEFTETPATDAYLAGIKADGVESGIKTIMTMLNHQAPGVSDAINVLRVHSSELREGADK
ncbi:hypothetical protein J9B37_13920 [Klebsiella pneumoniae]|uniref:hypothetical protein n=1 Tax=Klebsiella pneumoniae TaxID=573 RepID=UPI00192B7EFA|nr:hypothetical protein [Klebsiella pneumoniae]MBW8621497.1 hypothetical protein [Klebsiella pneumoniae]MBW8625866.1 hypothetical protein [Klebsiella pneumoniae]MBW8630827.1 hypothetical protein [Klebsiella pneumoniae]HCA3231060.1 hypothetical protein [Klebsiella pneumoniae]